MNQDYHRRVAQGGRNPVGCAYICIAIIVMVAVYAVWLAGC